MKTCHNRYPVHTIYLGGVLFILVLIRSFQTKRKKTDMRKEEILEDKIGRDAGFRLPDGYFEGFSAEIMSKLPPYPSQPKPQVLTTWQRMKPYVYLAAMFAGIWMMMKMFHDFSQAGQLNLDNPPVAVAEAIMDLEESNMMAYVGEDDIIAEDEIMSSIASEYESLEEFTEDFDYQFEPQYEDAVVPDPDEEGGL